MSDVVTRLNAALEGRYHIERQLGEGGMATVYLADDLRHERKVALKVLKPELAAVVGADRFLAEIKTTANLQHPHILPLFDSGEADSFLFYVMPYVEGESLRERLDREHQLPVDEAAQIAKDVAMALGYAHSRGVIHRDIKPANILLQAGRPVVADFGIALAVGAAGGARLTETGLSLGTPHYMSPEQATGDLSVGTATDVYALGCVLYEMLVGEPPFTGSTPQAVLGKIVAGDAPSPSEQRKSVPANVEAAIRKALEKVPADRFREASSLARALDDPAFRTAELAPRGETGHGASKWNILSVALLGVALALAGLTSVLYMRGAPGSLEATTSRFNIRPLQGELGSAQQTVLALSPNGTTWAYRALGSMWLEELGELEATQLAVDRGTQPTFSPDGLQVAFTDYPVTGVYVAGTGGSPPTRVADIEGSVGVGLTWGADGNLYFDTPGGIGRIESGGGELERVTAIDEASGERRHQYPEPLPGGAGVLFVVSRVGGAASAQIAVHDLATGEHRLLVPGVLARYGSGHLVWVTAQGVLMAQPFDEYELSLSGKQVRLDEGLPLAPVYYTAQLALSREGSMMYLRQRGRSETALLARVSRDGSEELMDLGLPGSVSNPGLSPDGNSLALEVEEPDGSTNIWIWNVDGAAAPRRLTFDGRQNMRPSWTPDGAEVIFPSDRAGELQLWAQPVDGGQPRPYLSVDAPILDGEWSRDGRTFLYRIAPNHIYAAVGEPGGEPIPLAVSDFNNRSGTLSPNGSCLAYSSDEAGPADVYVRAVQAGGTITRVSTGGGGVPSWSSGGRELFYVDADRQLVAVEMSGCRPISETILFSTGSYLGGINSPTQRYTPTLDAQAFWFSKQGESTTRNELIYVANWTADLVREDH